MTLIVTRCYFKEGRAKIEFAVARGKKKYDKRQSLREKDSAREARQFVVACDHNLGIVAIGQPSRRGVEPRQRLTDPARGPPARSAAPARVGLRQSGSLR